MGRAGASINLSCAMCRFQERLLKCYISVYNGQNVTKEGYCMESWQIQKAKKQPLSAIDALLAATAKVHDLTVVTRNVRDMQDCSIDIFNPWETA